MHDGSARGRRDRTPGAAEADSADLLGTLGLAKLLVRDPDGTIRFWSQGCERLYGWSAAEAVGQCAATLLHTEPSVPPEQIEDALSRDGEWSGDLVQTCRDGRRITVAAHIVPRRDANEAPVAVMESFLDVTALRQGQAGLWQQNRDLEQRVSQEVASREAAQSRAAHAERMQALGQLAGGIAHDFNNILQVVSGSAALIERRAGDKTAVARFVRRIIDSAHRGSTITRRMLVFARRGKLEAEAVEPAVLLEALREICAYTLGAGIEIRLDVAPNLPRLFADKGQLETALVNLATNARDAMVAGGVLTLSGSAEVVCHGNQHPAALRPGGYVRLSVSDTGSGMDSTVLARVTEPFFTTKGIGEGTGLGLSMVKGFVEQSGGGFTVTSEAGVGTVATLWLPQADDPAAAYPAETACPSQSPGAGRRVLLVDDDHLVRETLAAQLEAEGHSVLSASGGEDALALLDTSPIDVLVTDLEMPSMNGLLLIQQAQRSHPRVPAFLLTGYADDTAALALCAAGKLPQFSLIHKPVSGAQLSIRIAAALQSVASAAEPQPAATRIAEAQDA